MKTFFLIDDSVKRNACVAIMQAKADDVCTIKQKTRNTEQNAKFHAMCGELAGKSWGGKTRSATEWKVLLVSGHAIATGEPQKMTVGLEGEVVNLRESTAAMSIKRMASLIEYTQAWIANNFDIGE